MHMKERKKKEIIERKEENKVNRKEGRKEDVTKKKRERKKFFLKKNLNMKSQYQDLITDLNPGQAYDFSKKITL